MQPQQPKVCLVACSVLRRELDLLKRQGKLNAELVYVSKIFHVDYSQLETNLRKVLEHTKRRFSGKIVLVYGDLCLGLDGEMRRLADEYGVVKVDALNCIDCQLGGGGKSAAVDPEHNLMFMGPGMIEFFVDMRRQLREQGVDEAAFAGMYSGIKGAVLLDTLGDAEGLAAAFKASGVNLEILEVRSVGCGDVEKVVKNAAKQA